MAAPADAAPAAGGAGAAPAAEGEVNIFKDSAVAVCVRVRPFNERERGLGATEVVHVTGPQSVSLDDDPTSPQKDDRTFGFDQVFEIKANQEQVSERQATVWMVVPSGGSPSLPDLSVAHLALCRCTCDQQRTWLTAWWRATTPACSRMGRRVRAGGCVCLRLGKRRGSVAHPCPHAHLRPQAPARRTQ